jgi:medium-chain acyl-[acyl-carrier-protein] hydrolase
MNAESKGDVMLIDEGRRWVETYPVRSFDADAEGRARAAYLFRWMLDAAWGHVTGTPFGFSELEEQGRFWVLSKFFARFSRVPKWTETVRVETWGTGVERFQALRRFSLSLPDGTPLGEASSAWLILDRTTYRPQKLDDLLLHFQFSSDDGAGREALEKLPKPGAAASDRRLSVCFSDLDVNRHVNSARYLEWATDNAPAELRQAELASFRINFHAEARLDDVVSVRSEKEADGALLVGISRPAEGTELCTVRLSWKGAPAD